MCVDTFPDPASPRLFISNLLSCCPPSPGAPMPTRPASPQYPHATSRQAARLTPCSCTLWGRPAARRASSEYLRMPWNRRLSVVVAAVNLGERDSYWLVYGIGTLCTGCISRVHVQPRRRGEEESRSAGACCWENALLALPVPTPEPCHSPYPHPRLVIPSLHPPSALMPPTAALPMLVRKLRPCTNHPPPHALMPPWTSPLML